VVTSNKQIEAKLICLHAYILMYLYPVNPVNPVKKLILQNKAKFKSWKLAAGRFFSKRSHFHILVHLYPYILVFTKRTQNLIFQLNNQCNLGKIQGNQTQEKASRFICLKLKQEFQKSFLEDTTMFARSFLVFSVAVVLMLSAISLGATYGGGSGTSEDPYQIWTPQQMNTIGANSADWNKHFKLMADIDMSAYTGTQYKIIGAFSGTFNGNGYVIRNLNYSTISLGSYVGLFGQTVGATIKDLGVENVSISSGGNRIGALIGYNGGTVSNCFVSGTVQGDSVVGGIVGENYGIMKSCFSRCFVTGTNKCIGGLAGYNSGRITASCATGLVSGNSSVGGLVGDNGYCPYFR